MKTAAYLEQNATGNAVAQRQTLGDAIHFLLGLSLFAPGVAVMTVGHTTGVQAALVLAGLCGIVRLYKCRFERDDYLLLLLAGWAACLVVSVLIGGWVAVQVHAMISFDFCLLIIGIFALRSETPASYDLNLQWGLIAGGVLSTIYALYQQAALRVGLPFGIPPLNNPSFSLYADAADPGLRSFAFFPEPSMLAGYLIPISITMMFMAMNQQRTTIIRRLIIAAFLFVGIVASGSFSILIAVPIVIGACLYAQRGGVMGLLRVALASICMGALLLFLVATSSWAASVSDNLMERLTNATDDPSLMIRYGRDVASFRIFTEHPIFGAGVTPNSEYFFSNMPSEASRLQTVDTLTGGSCLPLDILAGHGFVGFLCFATLVVMALARSRKKMFLRLTLIGIVVVMTLQCSNIDLYLIWVVMGLCLAQRPNPSTTQGRGPGLLATRRAFGSGQQA